MEERKKIDWIHEKCYFSLLIFISTWLINDGKTKFIVYGIGIAMFFYQILIWEEVMEWAMVFYKSCSYFFLSWWFVRGYILIYHSLNYIFNCTNNKGKNFKNILMQFAAIVSGSKCFFKNESFSNQNLKCSFFLFARFCSCTKTTVKAKQKIK